MFTCPADISGQSLSSPLVLIMLLRPGMCQANNLKIFFLLRKHVGSLDVDKKKKKKSKFVENNCPVPSTYCW